MDGAYDTSYSAMSDEEVRAVAEQIYEINAVIEGELRDRREVITRRFWAMFGADTAQSEQDPRETPVVISQINRGERGWTRPNKPTKHNDVIMTRVSDS